MLTLNGAVTFTQASPFFRKNGRGVLEMAALNVTTLSLGNGTLRIKPNGTAAGVTQIKELDYELVGEQPNTRGIGTLDLTNNGLAIDYTINDPETDLSPLPLVTQLLQIGRDTGTGIISSSIASNPGTAIGYAEASQIGGTFFGTIPVDSTTVLVRYTRLGDADLSGGVSLDDFTRLAAGFGLGTDWANGDFTYDGLVNLDDFTALAANFGTSVADLPRSSVPEPGALSVLAVAAAGLLRRRRA